MRRIPMLEKTKLAEDTAASTVRGRTWPTPILVPKFVRNMLIVVTVLAVLAALVFVAWRVPSALLIMAGGLPCAAAALNPARAPLRLPTGKAPGVPRVDSFIVSLGVS